MRPNILILQEFPLYAASELEPDSPAGCPCGNYSITMCSFCTCTCDGGTLNTGA
jgi:hypothetical protein